MTLFTLAVAGVLGYSAFHKRGLGHPWGRATVLVAGLANPVAGLGLGVAWLALTLRRARAAPRVSEQAAQVEQTLLVHGLLVALSGGFSLAGALAVARPRLGSELGDTIERLLREAATTGLGPALQSATGVGGRLFRQLGAAQVTGAPVVVSLTAYASELHEAQRAKALQQAARLPVRMVVPLTLLMLPGFVLLTVGPTILSAFTRLMPSLAGS